MVQDFTNTVIGTAQQFDFCIDFSKLNGLKQLFINKCYCGVMSQLKTLLVYRRFQNPVKLTSNVGLNSEAISCT